MKNLIAQIKLAPEGGFRGLGPLGLEGRTGEEAPGIFTSFLSGVIGIMTVVAAIWFTFNFIIGAIQIISAGGDKGKVEAARQRITTGIIGLVVVIAAVFVIQLMGSLIGLGDIILNPVLILQRISPNP